MSNAPSSHDRDHASQDADLDPAIVELLDVLRDKGAPAAKLDAVQEILTKAPTTPAAACLVEHGIDEVLVQETVAGIAGIPFERIELERGAEGAVEGRLVQRLTADYCKSSGVMPLRMDGTRPVVGVTQDNVFLVDDIKTRLGVSSPFGSPSGFCSRPLGRHHLLSACCRWLFARCAGANPGVSP